MIKSKVNILILAVFGWFMACSKPEPPVSLTFTGDVILARGVSDKLKIYGDSLLSQRLKPLLEHGRNVINLETVLTKDTVPKTNGYALRADPSLAVALFEGGVDKVFRNNNHANDFGVNGSASTVYHLEKAGLSLSNGNSLFRFNDWPVSIIGTSLLEIENFERSQRINSLMDLIYSRSHGSNKRSVILYVHWGVEYQLKPTEDQRKLAHRLIDAGVDAIIGHHPHVFQTIEFYKHKPIIYSLGNFVADAYLPETTKGAMATVALSDTLGHIVIKPVDLSDYFPREMSTKEEMAFFQQSLSLNDSICFLKMGDVWQVRESKSISFKEPAQTWLFAAGKGRMLSLRQLSKEGYKLSTFDRGEFQSSIALYGEISQLMMADIDNDGQLELMINIRKAVDFDDEENNRLNIFDIETDGAIKTQWLGTKFLYPLQSFEAIKVNGMNYLKTIEIESGAKYERFYEWDEFGFALSQMDKPDHEE